MLKMNRLLQDEYQEVIMLVGRVKKEGIGVENIRCRFWGFNTIHDTIE